MEGTGTRPVWVTRGAPAGMHRMLLFDWPLVRLRRVRLLGLGVISSGVLVTLQLSTPLSMLLIYERVLPSRDAAALAGLTVLVMCLHGLFVLIDMGRTRVICREGLALAQALERDALDGERRDPGAVGAWVLKDAERVGRFLTGAGPPVLLDALWLPAYLAVVFMLHPLLALLAGAGGIALVALTVVAEKRACVAADAMGRVRWCRRTTHRAMLAARWGGDRSGWQWLRLERRWWALSRAYYRLSLGVARRALQTGAIGKGLRLALQSAVFGLGAFLVIEGALSPGQLFVASLIVGRMLASLDAALAHWSGVRRAHASYLRLSARAKPCDTLARRPFRS